MGYTYYSLMVWKERSSTQAHFNTLTLLEYPFNSQDFSSPNF